MHVHFLSEMYGAIAYKKQSQFGQEKGEIMYQLIAFDMDGTLLDSNKKIRRSSVNAIKKAVQAGKVVALSTGRGPAELLEYEEELKEVRYLICISGALVYDKKTGEKIYEQPLAIEDTKKAMEIADKEDVMFHILSEKSIVDKEQIKSMATHGMGIYRKMFDKVTIQKENLFAYYKEHPFLVSKLNLYHTTAEGRERTKKRLEEAGLPMEMVYAETTSLELTKKGVSKAKGLKELCKHLNIPIESTIAVGDADNDREILQTAGLSIAMGNAKESIKELADVIVKDCDHDGCVQAIEEYLLK